LLVALIYAHAALQAICTMILVQLGILVGYKVFIENDKPSSPSKQTI